MSQNAAQICTGRHMARAADLTDYPAKLRRPRFRKPPATGRTLVSRLGGVNGRMGPKCGLKHSSHTPTSGCELTDCAQPFRTLKIDRHELTHAFFRHRNAEQTIHPRHGHRIMRDDQKSGLGKSRHLFK